jgi:hypothetical protein
MVQRAGDLLSSLLGEAELKKAKGYSQLFSSWAGITAKCGLAAAGAHSKIGNVERNIVQIEADHPGWVQLLQTKQMELLDALRPMLPDMELRGISFRLGKPEAAATGPAKPGPGPAADKPPVAGPPANEPVPAADAGAPAIPENTSPGETSAILDSIKDEGLRESLRRLKAYIEARNR